MVVAMEISLHTSSPYSSPEPHAVTTPQTELNAVHVNTEGDNYATAPTITANIGTERPLGIKENGYLQKSSSQKLNQTLVLAIFPIAVVCWLQKKFTQRR